MYPIQDKIQKKKFTYTHIHITKSVVSTAVVKPKIDCLTVHVTEDQLAGKVEI